MDSLLFALMDALKKWHPDFPSTPSDLVDFMTDVDLSLTISQINDAIDSALADGSIILVGSDLELP